MVPKLAWVSPARPRLLSDSKSRPLVKGWGSTTTNPAISRAWCCQPKRNELPSFRERQGLSIIPIKSPTGPRLLLDSTALHALLDAGLHLILKLNCTRCRGRVSVVPKLAWVSPAQPRLLSDSKSCPTSHCMTSRRGGCWKGTPPLGQGRGRSGASPGHPPPGTLNDLPLILVAPYEKD